MRGKREIEKVEGEKANDSAETEEILIMSPLPYLHQVHSSPPL